MTRIPNLLSSAALSSLLVFGAACGGGDATGSATAQPISLTELDGLLDLGATRIEVTLVPGTLDAEELHAEAEDDDEKIESAVSSIDAVAGTLTLELGGLVISYDAGTRFRTPSDSDVERASWESAVSAGTFVEIRRDVPAVPQAPLDASFLALDLRIADETDEPSIEMLIGADSLEVVTTSSGVLHVLGLQITINAATELYDNNGSSSPDSDDEFESTVASVDVAAGTLTLTSGAIVDTTTVAFDAEGDLFSLQEVADAVAAGTAPVRAEGEGTANAAGMVVATELKVEVDD